MPTSASSRQHAVALGLLLLASAGAAAAWALIAVALDRQCGWMAVVAAIDAAWLLRFARMRAGMPRMLLALLGTLLAIVLANWWIAGTQIGLMVGLPPWIAIPRMGLAHAWTLSELANGAAELAWYGVALVVAALAGR